LVGSALLFEIGEYNALSFPVKESAGARLCSQRIQLIGCGSLPFISILKNRDFAVGRHRALQTWAEAALLQEKVEIVPLRPIRLSFQGFDRMHIADS
jgi:hypothetical protein